jgi:hypothetical protein
LLPHRNNDRASILCMKQMFSLDINSRVPIKDTGRHDVVRTLPEERLAGSLAAPACNKPISAKQKYECIDPASFDDESACYSARMRSSFSEAQTRIACSCCTDYLTTSSWHTKSTNKPWYASAVLCIHGMMRSVCFVAVVFPSPRFPRSHC